MSGKTIDGQRQHADVDERDGQAAERRRDGPAAQAVQWRLCVPLPLSVHAEKVWASILKSSPAVQVLVCVPGSMYTHDCASVSWAWAMGL